MIGRSRLFRTACDTYATTVVFCHSGQNKAPMIHRFFHSSMSFPALLLSIFIADSIKLYGVYGSKALIFSIMSFSTSILPIIWQLFSFIIYSTWDTIGWCPLWPFRTKYEAIMDCVVVKSLWRPIITLCQDRTSHSGPIMVDSTTWRLPICMKITARRLFAKYSKRLFFIIFSE